MSEAAATLAQVQQLMAQGRTDAAQAELRRALQKDPANPGLNNAMALTLMAASQFEQSLFFLDRALQSRPNEPILLINAGRALGSINRLDDALARFSRAAELAPTMIEAREGLAHMLRLKDRFTDAADQVRRALSTHPDDPSMAALYTGLLLHQARAHDAAAFSRDWLARHPHPAVAAAHAAAMTYDPEASPREVFEAQVQYGRLFDAVPAPPHDNDPAPDRPLRIGILSHELRRHAVATFLEGWLTHHDAAAARLFCYATAGLEDDVSARIKQHAASWANVSTLADTAIAQRIRADRIDILLETSGITEGQRLGVMALKPAPIQVSLIGYLNTTGLRAIDYRIADAHTEPPGSEAFSTEKLARLDPTYWCYRAPDSVTDVARRATGHGSSVAGASADPITFGSFNSISKLNDRVIALWTRVLLAAPGSRLLLKAFDLADPRLRDDLSARFASAGLEPSRLELEGPTLGPEFLSNYNRLDIALDPTPFNGTTTTLDALWMGIPVVTLTGDRHAGRTGVSILTTLALPELIATTDDEYIRIATQLAADAPRRSHLRATLRPRLAASPLCDAPAFARRMDEALRRMWRTWCAEKAR